MTKSELNKRIADDEAFLDAAPETWERLCFELRGATAKDSSIALGNLTRFETRLRATVTILAGHKVEEVIHGMIEARSGIKTQHERLEGMREQLATLDKQMAGIDTQFQSGKISADVAEENQAKIQAQRGVIEPRMIAASSELAALETKARGSEVLSEIHATKMEIENLERQGIPKNDPHAEKLAARLERLEGLKTTMGNRESWPPWLRESFNGWRFNLARYVECVLNCSPKPERDQFFAPTKRAHEAQAARREAQRHQVA